MMVLMKVIVMVWTLDKRRTMEMMKVMMRMMEKKRTMVAVKVTVMV